MYKHTIKISVKKIAEAINCDERYTQKLINELVRRGLLFKKQVGGNRSRNIYSLNREVFQYAKFLINRFSALKKYIFSVLKWVFGKKDTLYKKNNVINNNIIHSHVPLTVNKEPRANRMLTVSDHISQFFKKIIKKPEIDTLEWQDIGNDLVRNRKGIVRCIEDV